MKLKYKNKQIELEINKFYDLCTAQNLVKILIIDFGICYF